MGKTECPFYLMSCNGNNLAVSLVWLCHGRTDRATSVKGEKTREGASEWRQAPLRARCSWPLHWGVYKAIRKTKEKSRANKVITKWSNSCETGKCCDRPRSEGSAFSEEVQAHVSEEETLKRSYLLSGISGERALGQVQKQERPWGVWVITTQSHNVWWEVGLDILCLILGDVFKV